MLFSTERNVMQAVPNPNDYPREPGRSWMLWALSCLDDDESGSNEDLTDRLALHGFDVAPPVDVTVQPTVDKPYPSKPTDGWLLNLLKSYGVDHTGKRDALIRRAHALGFTEIQE